MIWNIIRNSVTDIWDEMLYLMIFNVIWVIGVIPGFLLIVQGAALSSLPIILLGVILLLPSPFVTFGLFFTVYDISQAKGIGFGTFWRYGLQAWRQAYIWGGVNLAVLLVIGANLSFYAGLEAQWTGLAQMFITAIGLLWLILQLIALPFYPRLEQPGLKLALRNAGITLGRYPLIVFCLIIVVGLVLAVAAFFSIIVFLGAFSIIAVVANRVVDAVVAREEQRKRELEA